MDLTIVRSSQLLLRQSSSRLLSRTLPHRHGVLSETRQFSYSRQLATPDHEEPRPLDPIERQKAVDRAQWIKDLNDAIPSWSNPRPAIPRRLRRKEDSSDTFGVKSGSKNSTASGEQSSQAEDAIMSDSSTAPPTRNLHLFEAKTNAQAFAEKVNAINYDLRLSPRTAYRMPVSGTGGTKETELARVLQKLNGRASANKVQLRVQRQRFHERPGLRRKRMRKEKWRTRFKTSFGSICARVTELSKKGW
jgi:small subunit ribosomal protein MRP21